MKYVIERNELRKILKLILKKKITEDEANKLIRKARKPRNAVIKAATQGI